MKGFKDKYMEENKILQDCDWKYSSEKMKVYHDTRWCNPVHDDKELFAMLILEGAQAGLSWSTIIDREENYRKAFEGFDPEKIAGYDEAKVSELLMNEGIIRNKLKIRSAIKNASAFLKIEDEFGSFDNYIWGFTGGKVIDNHIKKTEDIPAESKLSRKVSMDLKKRGFTFAGPVIIYSYLEGIGIINDHIETCIFR